VIACCNPTIRTLGEPRKHSAPAGLGGIGRLVRSLEQVPVDIKCSMEDAEDVNRVGTFD
jgi:hypothetical protein